LQLLLTRLFFPSVFNLLSLPSAQGRTQQMLLTLILVISLFHSNMISSIKNALLILLILVNPADAMLQGKLSKNLRKMVKSLPLVLMHCKCPSAEFIFLLLFLFIRKSPALWSVLLLK
tara:strand:+ start:283 stop:636 length:354 start_codon:yes stop_codon:yes gene_type:complete